MKSIVIVSEKKEDNSVSVWEEKRSVVTVSGKKLEVE
jgi:hypothetical protein